MTHARPESPECQDSEEGVERVLFTPPAWDQRRIFALSELRSHYTTVDWVLELGCGEGTLAHTLTNSSMLSRVSIVDIDKSVVKELEEALQPRHFQTFTPQERPLRLEIFSGCLTSKEPKFKGVHAIVMFEVIEHLTEDILEKVPEVVFGFYAPSLVLISTPNADYNLNFPGYIPGTFRHDDHKFEWTAKEFQTWGDSCAEKYGYNVSYTGVARRPQDSCFSTQIAIFEHKEKRAYVKKWPVGTGIDEEPLETKDLEAWESVATIDFPWAKEITCDSSIQIGGTEDTVKRIKNCLGTLPQSCSVADLWSNLYVRRHFRSIELLRQALYDCPEISIDEHNATDKECEIWLGSERGERISFKITEE